MKYTNFKMEQMLSALRPLLNYKNEVGYCAARNTRLLRDNLTEFSCMKDDLIREYGEATIVDGKPTGNVSISPTSEKFGEFMSKLQELGNIEHELDLMSLPYSKVIDILTGKELLELDWMLVD